MIYVLCMQSQSIKGVISIINGLHDEKSHSEKLILSDLRLGKREELMRGHAGLATSFMTRVHILPVTESCRLTTRVKLT